MRPETEPTGGTGRQGHWVPDQLLGGRTGPGSRLRGVHPPICLLCIFTAPSLHSPGPAQGCFSPFQPGCGSLRVSGVHPCSLPEVRQGRLFTLPASPWSRLSREAGHCTPDLGAGCWAQGTKGRQEAGPTPRLPFPEFSSSPAMLRVWSGRPRAQGLLERVEGTSCLIG